MPLLLQPSISEGAISISRSQCLAKDSNQKHPCQIAGLSIWFSFSQTSNSISFFPLTTLLEQLNSLEPLEYITFCAKRTGAL
jgi:hypothetical protein